MSLSPLASFKSRFVTYLLNFPRLSKYRKFASYKQASHFIQLNEVYSNHNFGAAIIQEPPHSSGRTSLARCSGWYRSEHVQNEAREMSKWAWLHVLRYVHCTDRL